MLLFCRVTILIMLLLSANITHAEFQQTTQPIPLRDFFRDPQQSNFKLSPNAKYIAFLQPWQNRLNVFVQKLSKDRLPIGAAKQITFITDRSLKNYIWKGDDIILYSKDNNGNENFHIHAANLNTNETKDLTPFHNVRAIIMDDLYESSSDEILVQTNQRDPHYFDVYKLNVITGSQQLVAKNNGKISAWFNDHNGEVRIAKERDGLQTTIYSRRNNKDIFKPIIQYDYTYNCFPLLFSSDNQFLYISANLYNDKDEIIKIDPITGKVLQSIYSHPSVDVSELVYSRLRKKIIAAAYIDWKKEYHFFEQSDAELFNKLKNKLGNLEIYYNSKNSSEDLYIITVRDDRVANRHYLYDLKNDLLTLLYDSAVFLPREKLAEMRPIHYKARDGVLINGYLTMPAGSSGKNLPVVINPHGGPYERNQWQYNPEVQFLANRGYAVLQINYRGSSGYGRDFLMKSFKQWGKAMQDDITDGVNWLIANSIADPKRIAIYGASYGGYATLAGITFTPDLYACAVDYVGVSNLFTFMQTVPQYWQTHMQQYKEMVGDPVKDKALFEEISPIFHVDRIKTPLLVAQGAKDPRVNINESNQIVNALRQRGVEVTYLVKENEGHGFSNAENKFEFYEAMERFLEQHLQN